VSPKGNSPPLQHQIGRRFGPSAQATVLNLLLHLNWEGAIAVQELLRQELPPSLSLPESRDRSV